MSEERDAKRAQSNTKSTPVTIVFDDANYKTTKETLLGRDENSFFHLQLLGRQVDVLKIHNRCGKTFFDVLYYLRFGDVPRDASGPILSSEQLERLKEEARFYLLPGLEKICTLCPLFTVTEFPCSKQPQVKVTKFVSYEIARAYYNAKTKGMLQEEWEKELEDYYTNERSIQWNVEATLRLLSEDLPQS